MKSLDALGWIQRESDARDNRVTNVTLTDDGRAAFDACLPRRKAFLEQTMAQLPDDVLTALSGALAMLESRIADVGSTPAAR